MIKKVEDYMEQHHMIAKGDTIVAGVSGGADSVCLFWILKEYCRKKDAQLVVVHVNHGIRPEAAADEEYVRGLCQKEGILFYPFQENIPLYAKDRGIGTEEAGRMVRYHAFETVCGNFPGPTKIAVAHNRNDQAETMLFHLLRGSGVAGLSGIMPVRERIIRPLLCVERREIEDFLTQKGVEWCIDSTNEENTYTRNKLRNVVFPYLKEEVCVRSVDHVAQAAEEIAEVRIFLDELTDGAEETVLKKQDGRVLVFRDAFLKQPGIIKKQLLLRAFTHLVSSRKDIGKVHVDEILSLMEKESGKQIVLPYGLRAVREFDRIVIGKRGEEKKERRIHPAVIPGTVETEDGTRIEFSLIKAENSHGIVQKKYTKWFDYGKIQNCPVLRTRQTGDYLTISPNGGHKTIKEYFIEEKIPVSKRDDQLLLADDKHILWVVGMRISEFYKVTDRTKEILQVTIKDTKEERSCHG